MKYEFYNQMPLVAQIIREKVFVEEQKFEKEFDDIDNHCIHLVVYDNNEAVGCARMYEANSIMILGRIAIVREKRYLHIGSEMLSLLEEKAKQMNYTKVQLSSQVRAKDFYVKNGYQPVGEEYLDEYCPHITMQKVISL